MKYDRFLPLIVPFIVLLSFELLFFYPRSVYLSFGIALLIILVGARRIATVSEKKEKWWSLFLLPLYLTIGTFLLVIILPLRSSVGIALIQTIFALSTIIIHLYFRSIYSYLINTARYRKNSLAYFSSYANFIAVYFIASAAFGLQSFLSLSIWILMFIVLVFVAAAAYETMWASNISGPSSFFYLALSCLSVFEIVWVVSFLPLSFYIMGLLVAISFYIILGLVRMQLLDSLNRGIIKTYLTLGVMSLILVLMTARWI
jgi:hypothetical protein